MLQITGFPNLLDLALHPSIVWGILILIAIIILVSSIILFYHWGRFGHNSRAIGIYIIGVILLLGGALYLAFSVKLF
jgi:hypothetical protein